MLIPVEGPFDLEGTLLSGQAFRWRLIDGWQTSVMFDNVVRLRAVQRGVEMTCGPDPETRIAPLLHDYLGLGVDVEQVYRTFKGDGPLDRAMAEYRGLRVLRQDPWECLIAFIVSSNSNIRRISGNLEDIASRFGLPVEHGGHRQHAFPAPASLLTAGEDALKDLRLGYRARYVAETTEIVAGGGIDLHALREATYEETLAALTELPGVGDKVANCVMLFSLDKPQAFPVDVWVRRALQEWYLPPGAKLSDKNMRIWAQERFGRYAGYANQYLFHHRRLLEEPDGLADD